MSTISRAVNAKVGQWEMEAILFCAAAGRKGLPFVVSKWANGRVMIAPAGARCNQAIDMPTFNRLKANDWKWSV